MSPKVGELFAGIGGFGLAAQRAGFELAWACEIDDFASRVYGARFPTVPVHPDVRDFEGVPVDCITAGFPCQDLSVAGKRKGLVGERSGLFWEIVRIASRLRPRWLLLENVPGLLSSHRGRDFETVLAALDELGYGVAWRVLDAQFFGVPQRRRRVFIVGHLGGPCPPEVLFEPEGVPRDSQKGRQARAGVTGDVAACINSGGNAGGFRTEPGAHIVSMTTQPDGSPQGIGRGGPVVAATLSAEHGRNHGLGNANETELLVTHSLRVETSPRRLTPRECERLQGFPDDWTLIDGASDSARYRALGNAVAVPCVEWILRRLVVA